LIGFSKDPSPQGELSEAKGGGSSKATRRTYKTKNPHQINDEDSQKKGGDILSHRMAVPSAQSGLTSLFGMGRGEPRRNNHLKFLVECQMSNVERTARQAL